MKKPVFVSAQDAAAMIGDGKTVATIGMTLVSASETILKAIEKRFLETGSPNQLTLVHSCGQSDRDRGIQHFSHDGMLKCIIGGHWGLQPRMMKMIAENKMLAYKPLISENLKEMDPAIFNTEGAFGLKNYL